MLTLVTIGFLLCASSTVGAPMDGPNASACCLPKQWEGTIGEVLGTVSGGQPSATEQAMAISYDYNLLKVALVGDGYKIIQDYNKMMKYTIVGGTKCTSAKLKGTLFNCIPSNATFLGSFRYGGPQGLKVNDFSKDSFVPGNFGRISVSDDGCLPVIETAAKGGDDGYFIVMGYVNIVNTIKDPSVFDVPSPPCPMDPVVGMPISGRSGIFGQA